MGNEKKDRMEEKGDVLDVADLSNVTGGCSSNEIVYQCHAPANFACPKNAGHTPSANCFEYPSCNYAGFDPVVID